MLDYRHLMQMTDETGILQFCKMAIPDARSGYTLDDNARALIVSIQMESAYEYAFKYASYLNNAQQKDGSWSNFLLDGKYSPRFDSEDSFGRALLACSLAASSPWPDIAEMCQEMFNKNLPRVLAFRSPRAIAYSLLALCKSVLPDSYERKSNIIARLTEYLIVLYQSRHSPKWLWFEDYLTYCNGILPQAMFAVYAANGDKKALKIGHDSLNFLNSILFRDGYLNIIGNQGWYQRGSTIALFDQQPVDAASIIFACFEAYENIGEVEYLEMATLAYQWYRGRNLHGISLYDKDSGGCYDALTPKGVNQNRGAEAVLSLLLSDSLMENLIKQKIDIDKTS